MFKETYERLMAENRLEASMRDRYEEASQKWGKYQRALSIMRQEGIPISHEMLEAADKVEILYKQACQSREGASGVKYQSDLLFQALRSAEGTTVQLLKASEEGLVLGIEGMVVKITGNGAYEGDENLDIALSDSGLWEEAMSLVEARSV